MELQRLLATEREKSRALQQKLDNVCAALAWHVFLFAKWQLLKPVNLKIFKCIYLPLQLLAIVLRKERQHAKMNAKKNPLRRNKKPAPKRGSGKEQLIAALETPRYDKDWSDNF